MGGLPDKICIASGKWSSDYPVAVKFVAKKLARIMRLARHESNEAKSTSAHNASL